MLGVIVERTFCAVSFLKDFSLNIIIIIIIIGGIP